MDPKAAIGPPTPGLRGSNAARGVVEEFEADLHYWLEQDGAPPRYVFGQHLRIARGAAWTRTEFSPPLDSTVVSENGALQALEGAATWHRVRRIVLDSRDSVTRMHLVDGRILPLHPPRRPATMRDLQSPLTEGLMSRLQAAERETRNRTTRPDSATERSIASAFIRPRGRHQSQGGERAIAESTGRDRAQRAGREGGIRHWVMLNATHDVLSEAVLPLPAQRSATTPSKHPAGSGGHLAESAAAERPFRLRVRVTQPRHARLNGE